LLFRTEIASTLQCLVPELGQTRVLL
jgi:hypothetical protein